MKTNLNKTLSVAVLALTGSVFAATADAALINLSGSSTIGASGASLAVGSNLNSPGLQINVTSPFYGTNTGDFSPILPLSAFFVGTFDLTNPSSWDITGSVAGNIGTYAVSQLVIIAQSANFLNVYTRGMFTPGTVEGTQLGGCATGGNTCAPTDSSLRWSFSQSGQSISASGTFNSPSIAIPEPASLGLLSIGLLGWAVARRSQAKMTAA